MDMSDSSIKKWHRQNRTESNRQDVDALVLLVSKDYDREVSCVQITSPVTHIVAG